MGVWSSMLGWRTLLRWDVLGVIVPSIFLAIGLTMLGVEWFPHNLLIAQVTFTLAVVFFLVKTWNHAITSEDTRFSRAVFAGAMSLVFIVPEFLVIRSIQRHKADPTAFSPLISFLAKPLVADLLWMLLGILVLVVGDWLLRATQKLIDRRRSATAKNKGFLDFRLQAETAMSDAGPAIEPITKIVIAVAAAMTKQTIEVKAAALLSTRDQIAITRRTARKLDRHSREIDSKCFRLECIGSSLQEGLHGWYTWLNKQELSRVTLSQMTPALIQFCESMRYGIQGTDDYIASLTGLKGVSFELNEAVDRHIKVIKRVRNANSSILDACLNAIHIASTPSSLEAGI